MAIIHGTNGNDRDDLGGSDLIGGASGDSIYGYAGHDWLEGGGGHDYLDGADGINTILGGEGNDSILSRGTGGWFDGGAGTDRMSFAGASTGGVFDLGAGNGKLGSYAAFTMQNFENFIGTEGTDSITATNAANQLAGGGGGDSIYAGGGDDIVHGGAGGDYLEGGDGADQMLGEAGDDDLIGGANADRMNGGDGSDLLWGGLGDDVMFGGRGSDTIDGGEGGFDTATYDGHWAAVTVNMAAMEGSSVVNGATEVDDLFRIDKVIGSNYADTMIGASGTELDGGAGADSIYASATAEKLSGGSGADWLQYSGSNAAVSVNLATGAVSGGWAQGDQVSAFENVWGSAHGDTLRGDGGANQINGGAGEDKLYGEGGADVITGGTGWDEMWGGTGADTFRFALNDSPYVSGPDIVRDFSTAQGDKIDISTIDARPDLSGSQNFSNWMEGVDTPGWENSFVAGTVAVKISGGDTYVELNTSDATSNQGFDAPEFQIRLDGYHDLSWSDFIL